MFDSIIIGTGMAGAVIGRELAEKGNQKVLMIDQRNHIGGNCYDMVDDKGVLIHLYGPHIFHTNNKTVFDYLSRFTEWYPYEHKVAANVYGSLMPVPFNLKSLNVAFGEDKGAVLKEKLVNQYGMDTKVTILELQSNADPDIQEVAAYVYENIFLKYTMKQWGQTPDQVDKSVISRVPVLISYDERYFQDTYQGMPLAGYTKLFANLLDHQNITVRLKTKAQDIFSIDEDQILFDGQPFTGNVIYTGPIDELLNYKYGRLPYRSLAFQFEYYDKAFYQSHGVVNYTVDEDYTRITEFKHMTGQKIDGTTIIKEYPLAFTGEKDQIPYYSVINSENRALYEQYVNDFKGLPNLHFLGRLAEYQYYNMDAMAEKALNLSQQLL